MSEETVVKGVTKAVAIVPTVESSIEKTANGENGKQNSVQKAEHFLQLEHTSTQADWYTPKYNREKMQLLIDNSTILPQCCYAYGSNIAGFGIEPEYLDEFKEGNSDENEKSTQKKEMEAEWDYLQEILDTIHHECPLTEFFSKLIQVEEGIGVAYIEVMRSPDGTIQQIDIIKEPHTIMKSKPTGDYVEVKYLYKGKEKTYKKQFCKYKQEIDGETVYFKECGDQRVMNCTDGKYYSNVKFREKTHMPFIVSPDGKETDIPIGKQANEILELKLGDEPYGKPRWIGNALNIDGSWRAENLNNNYFRHGRHTPLMIMIEGGNIDDESKAELQKYVNAVEGDKGQHGFLVICSQPKQSNPMMPEEKPKITVKELGAILQKDELFGNYIESSRKRVQSSFGLPDLYVGYTTDFNRATAQVAIEVTEKQIFQPRRESLAWFVNNKLLANYNFKYVRVKFNAPEITTVEDLVSLLRVGIEGNALSPNTIKDAIFAQLGLQAEAFPDDLSEMKWGDVPPHMFERWINGVDSTVLEGFTKSINKAEQEGASEKTVSLLRQVYKELKKYKGDENAESD